MDRACRWVIKYFSCFLGNAVLSGPDLDHAVLLQHAAIRQWRRRLSACDVQAGGGHFEHNFYSSIAHMQTC